MVARVDRPHYCPPHSHVAHPTSMTFSSPKLSLKTTCGFTSRNLWTTASCPAARSNFSPASSPSAIARVLPKPSIFSGKPVIPCSNVMSNLIIQSFRNRLLFAVPVCASIRGLSFPKTTLFAVEALQATCTAEQNDIKLNSPEGNLNNESEDSDALLTLDTCQPHQSSAATCFLESSSMNLINPDDVIPCCHNNQETANNDTADQLGEDEDLDQSDSDPSHSEYESDDEDFIEFSDESLPSETEVPLLELKSVNYVTLCSSESGYFECVPEPSHVDDETLDDYWSDSDSDETEFCSEVWDSFETQALSPMITCRRITTTTAETTIIPDTCNSTVKTVCQASHQQDNESLDQIPNMGMTELQSIAPQTDCSTLHNPNKPKQVRFKPDHELLEVHTIVAWEYAYRAARKGPWEQYARDRSHFKRRIDSVASILEPCLSARISCIDSS